MKKQKCPNCASSEFVLVEQRGHLQMLRCARCGTEINTRVYPDEDFADTEHVEVTLLWNVKEPTASDIVSLRQLVPNAASVSINGLLIEIKQTRKWYAGRYSMYHAEQLQKKAESLGWLVDKTSTLLE